VVTEHAPVTEILRFGRGGSHEDDCLIGVHKVVYPETLVLGIENGIGYPAAPYETRICRELVGKVRGGRVVAEAARDNTRIIHGKHVEILELPLLDSESFFFKRRNESVDLL